MIEHINVILSVKDMKASRAFYVDLLGFKEVEWGNDSFTSFHLDGKGFYVCQGFQGHGGSWVWVGFSGDIFDLHTYLVEKGANVLQPPHNYSWALEMHVADPDGNVLRFGTEPNDQEPYVDHLMKGAY